MKTKTIPVEPPPELLMSMAVRMDHGLGVPGYYDQPIFGAEPDAHKRRVESALTDMRRVYDEVVGQGFYREERRADCAKELEAALDAYHDARCRQDQLCGTDEGWDDAVQDVLEAQANVLSAALQAQERE